MQEVSWKDIEMLILNIVCLDSTFQFMFCTSFANE